MERIKKAQELVREKNGGALLIEHPTDLYYLTHLELSAGTLMIDQQEAVLFVDGRYIEVARKNSPCLVKPLEQFSEVKAKKVLFDSAKTSYKRYLELAAQFDGLEGHVSPLSVLRQIKDRQEIDLLKKSAALCKKGYQAILPLCIEGVSEKEIAQALEIFWMKEAGEAAAFSPIIAFGANSSQPHYRAGNARLKASDPILIDIGVMFHHYASDMTRVHFLGTPSKKMDEIYRVVDEARSAAKEAAKPGCKVAKLDALARDVITKAGYGECFTHNLGHGVGLDVHEFPFLKQARPFGDVEVLPGMVFTIEPGIYLEGIGGVRLEDTILITDNGCETLT